MPTRLQVAYQLAPVFVQKVHGQNPRGDFITRIDFTRPGDLTSLLDNWVAVNRLKGGGPKWTAKRWRRLLKNNKQVPEFEHKLEPYIYYSVVETEYHYFVIYAAYHPQDWKPSDAKKTFVSFEGPIWGPNEHEHDMEGALVVARKKNRIEDLRADIIITISHWDFYSYAFWYLTDKSGKGIPVFSGIDEDIYRGASENIDGKIWATWHTDEGGVEKMRPQLFVQAQGHGIKGDRKGWGRERRITHYCPSLSGTDEPTMFKEGSPDPKVKLTYRTSPDRTSSEDLVVRKEVYRYKLIDIFKPNTNKYPVRGLWESRNKRRLFQENDEGLKCFAVCKKGKLKAGSAKPPWSWDDKTDVPTILPGWLATHPAEVVFYYGYSIGFDKFTHIYKSNRYENI